MLSLRWRKDHKKLISILYMVSAKLLVLEMREYVTSILRFESERMKTQEKEIYRQRVSLLIQQWSHHFHSSHSFLLCLLGTTYFETENCILQTPPPFILSTKITFFVPTSLSLVWKLNNYHFSYFLMTTKRQVCPVATCRNCNQSTV